MKTTGMIGHWVAAGAAMALGLTALARETVVLPAG